MLRLLYTVKTKIDGKGKRQKNMKNVFLKPGEIFVGHEPTSLHTVLGSCISVFVFDVRLKIGGANHYVLPHKLSGLATPNEKNTYGDFAIRELFKRFKKAGSRKEDLQVKIIGGADVLDGNEQSLGADVGRLNIAIARHMLRSLGIPIAKESVGGRVGRKVEFFTATGQLKFRPINSVASAPALGATTTMPTVLAKPKDEGPIKVMIIDDSRPIRLALRRLIEEDKGFTVVAEAADPFEAMEHRKTIKPDVITLDINMPKMDGITYLKKYIHSDPVPTILITGYSLGESGPVFDGLENGAFDYLEKPSFAEMAGYGERIREMVRAAAGAKQKKFSAQFVSAKEFISAGDSDIKNTLIAIGASTGGTEAIKQVLTMLPANVPPIVIVQHIPALFSNAFAQRLNTLCAFSVKEAEHGDELLPGCAFVAPGGHQMRIKTVAGSMRIEITEDPPMNRFRPSVDYLFESVKKAKEKRESLHIVAALLTGMGADGAQGLLSLKNVGAETMAQDEKTCVVFGMPREAILLGAANHVAPLDGIAKLITHSINKGNHSKLQNHKVMGL